jgi:peptidoglycan/LPS O-acetylase OafA/YrhL
VGFYLIGATSNLEQLQYDPAARSIAIIAGCLLAAAPFSFRYGLALGWLLYGFTCVFCMNSIGTNLIFTPIGVFGAVLLVTHAERSRVLTFWPLIWFGWISYSLYLWHPATLRFMPDHRTLAVLLAVIVAAVSTYAIENPIRQQGITWLRQRWRPAEPAAAAASA